MRLNNFWKDFRILIDAKICRLIITKSLINNFKNRREVLIIKLKVNSFFNRCLKGKKYQ